MVTRVLQLTAKALKKTVFFGKYLELSVTGRIGKKNTVNPYHFTSSVPSINVLMKNIFNFTAVYSAVFYWGVENPIFYFVELKIRLEIIYEI